ncbi:13191_t:CDS:1, partial [Cetraspora pellucida]
MGSKKEFKNKELEVKRLDKKTFQRIKEEFKQYQKYLFGLIAVYIICYSIWFNVAEGAGNFLHSHGYDKNSRVLVISIAILQGLLFSLDGFVTALLKSPFNQMCYAINKSEGIPYKKKRSIITLATRSNEHCKETLKKMGMLTIVTEMIRIFIMGRGIIDKDLEPY